MITEMNGNILHDDADALVNTVNCVGVMGKGLALAFKQRYPQMFQDYTKACRRGELRPGLLHTWRDENSGQLIINLPTKRHWRQPSLIEDVVAGMNALVPLIQHENITSIAIPPLGCGLGGLDWRLVRPVILGRLEPLVLYCDLDVRLYAPAPR